MLKKNKKGFTLIEIIVVIVILAVLMAVAVPSVLKYINVAQEAPALTEAHAIVTAAQKRVIEKYSQNRTSEVSLDSDDNNWIEKFVDKGGTIQGDVVLSNNEVSSLLYKASNGLYVLYENQKYTIVEEDTLFDNTINGMYRWLNYTSNKEQILVNMPNDNTGKNASKALQKEFLNRYNGSYPKLTDKELRLLTYNNLTFNGNTSSLAWKPMYAKNGQVILIADSLGSSNANALGVMIYYNNTYYLHQFGNRLTTVSIKEGGLEFDENGTPIDSNTNNFWIKVEQ